MIKKVISEILRESDFDWVGDIKGVSYSKRYEDVLDDVLGLDEDVNSVDVFTLNSIIDSLSKLQSQVMNNTKIMESDLVYEIESNINNISNYVNRSKNQTLYETVKDYLVSDLTELIKRLTLINESNEFDWTSEVEETPNHQGYPQGVVPLRTHEDVDEYLNLFKGFLTTNDGRKKNIEFFRREYHDSIDHIQSTSTQYGTSLFEGFYISACFFINNTNPLTYDIAHFSFPVNEKEVQEYIDDFACGKHYVDCENWKMYDNLTQVKGAFKNTLKEDFDWVNNVSEFTLGDDFEESDVSYDDTDSKIYLGEQGRVTFNLDYDEFIDLVYDGYDDWCLSTTIKHNGQYDGNDNEYVDDDEIQYLHPYLSENQINRIQEVLNSYTNKTGLDRVGVDSYADDFRDFKPIVESILGDDVAWDEFVDESLSHIGYFLEINRWKLFWTCSSAPSVL